MALILPPEHVPGPSHGLDNRHLGASTLTWLVVQSEGAEWVCWVYTSDGRLIVRESPVNPAATVAPVRPDQERREAARRLVMHLNRKINMGGAWLVAWYGVERLECFWKDVDGDFKCSCTFADAWARMRQWPFQRFLDSCAAAWLQCVENERLLDVRPQESYKLALGESPPSSRR